jgi:NADPH-dependent curcumin reductase CurA|tara:strand:- start:1383 stop:1667 length:285 start_codon:yes stop_codon:yes gene_type:complete
LIENIMPTQYKMTRFVDPNETSSIWKRTEEPLPELGDGQVNVRLDWVSIDPGMMGWVTNKRSYMPPVQPGNVMRAFGVGEVTESNSLTLEVGDL